MVVNCILNNSLKYGNIGPRNKGAITGYESLAGARLCIRSRELKGVDESSYFM